MKKLIPVGDNLIIRPAEDDLTAMAAKAGLVLADTLSKDKPNVGEVVAVGEGRLMESGIRRPIPVQAGDTVIFTKFGGNDFELHDEKLLLVSVDDILAILREE
jgi:chaperonin GroES